VVQLASGLNYRDAQGQWQPTVAAFEPAPDGAFVARRGPHQVRLPAYLAAAEGVEVVGPDQVRLRLAPVGLGWFDPLTRRSVLLAEAQDAPAELLATNQVVYRDAFRGLKASVRYTYTRGGFSQHIILEEALAPPGAYGLGDQSRLEVYTELLESSREPGLTSRVLRPANDPGAPAGLAAPGLVDTTLDFGALRMGRGRAFLTSSEAARATRQAGAAWTRGQPLGCVAASTGMLR
jgi:hypothetical protein